MEVFRPCGGTYEGCCPEPSEEVPFSTKVTFFLYDGECPAGRCDNFGEISNEEEDCPLVLIGSPNEDSPNSGEAEDIFFTAATSLSFHSGGGMFRKYDITQIDEIIHPPTPTCYFKLWAKYASHNFSWIFDDCVPFQTVFPVPPTSNNYNGFEEIGSFEYEWRGSGRPCFADPSKPFFAEENLIRGAVGETFDIGLASRGEYKVGELVFKYSIVEGLEPEWPEFTQPILS